MSYYILGRDCTPATIALTSNTKFIKPLSNIYDMNNVKKKEKKKKDESNEDFYKKILEDLLFSKRVENIKTFDNKCSTC
jgi:hypothetical protein